MAAISIALCTSALLLSVVLLVRDKGPPEPEADIETRESVAMATSDEKQPTLPKDGGGEIQKSLMRCNDALAVVSFLLACLQCVRAGLSGNQL